MSVCCEWLFTWCTRKDWLWPMWECECFTMGQTTHVEFYWRRRRRSAMAHKAKHNIYVPLSRIYNLVFSSECVCFFHVRCLRTAEAESKRCSVRQIWIIHKKKITIFISGALFSSFYSFHLPIWISRLTRLRIVVTVNRAWQEIGCECDNPNACRIMVSAPRVLLCLLSCFGITNAPLSIIYFFTSRFHCFQNVPAHQNHSFTIIEILTRSNVIECSCLCTHTIHCWHSKKKLFYCTYESSDLSTKNLIFRFSLFLYLFNDYLLESTIRFTCLWN